MVKSAEHVAPNVVRFTRPPAAHPQPAEDHDRAVAAIALRAWQLHIELAWVYPRLCYALWSAVSTVPGTGRTRRTA